jgi:hypothetical protein
MLMLKSETLVLLQWPVGISIPYVETEREACLIK